MVGAIRDDNYTGAAYVFRWNGCQWEEGEKLTASDEFDGDSFEDDNALVGAWRHSHGVPRSGASYVYRLGPDCNQNEVPDTCHVRDGKSDDINGNDIPDECEACADDADCHDNDECTLDQCVHSLCAHGPKTPGDVDIFDLSCELYASSGSDSCSTCP